MTHHATENEPEAGESAAGAVMPADTPGLRRTGTHGNNVSFEYGTMPDTLTPAELLDAIEPYSRAIVSEYLVALTAAVEGLTLYDENARTMADAAESMRRRVLAIMEPHDA